MDSKQQTPSADLFLGGQNLNSKPKGIHVADKSAESPDLGDTQLDIISPSQSSMQHVQSLVPSLS